MRQKLMCVCLLASILFAGAVRADEGIEEKSLVVQEPGRDVGEFVTREGRFNLETAIRSGYEGPLDLKGFSPTIDPATGQPLFQPSGTQTAADHPDDIYWDNSISPSLPGADGRVSAMVVYNGNLVVGGDFSVIGDTPANRIALWNGSTWTPLGAGLGGEVYALTIYHNKLIAAGFLFSADGQLVHNIAAWDGTSWSPLGEAGPDAGIAVMTVYEDRLIVGGYFRTIGSDTVNYIASWDGSAWSPLGSGMNGYVWSFVEYDHKLIAGGNFRVAGGKLAVGTASWDGTEWAPLGSESSEGLHSKSVVSLTVFQNKLVAGGWFNYAGSNPINVVAAWDGTTWSPFTADAPEEPVVRSLVVYNNVLLAAGSYWNDGVLLQGIHYWNGLVWRRWGGWGANRYGYARILAVYDNKLVAAGNLALPAPDSPGQFSEVSYYDGSSWKPYYGPGINRIVRALTVYRGSLIAGGNLSSAGGVPVNHIASWDGTSWSPLQAGLDRSVASMMIYDDKLVVGGGFTMAGDSTAQHVATWDGENWAPLGSGTPLGVLAMARYNNAITVAGEFEDGPCPDESHVYVSIRSWDGSAWPEITSYGNCGAYVRDLVAFDDKLLMFIRGWMGGDILSWDGTSWSRISGILGVYGGSIVMNGKLLVGKQTAAGWGPSVSWVDSWDGSTWSDMEWDIDGLARAFAFFDRRLIVGGSFSSIGGISANNIAAWDGETWSALGSGTNGPVDRLAAYNGTLIIAGNFTTAGDKLSPFMAVWTRHDTLEVALDVKPGSCTNPVNGNSAHGQGKAVLPVAIMGTVDFDVHDIDPTTVTLNGTSPVRWNYGDVGAPPDDPDDECACSEAGPDGYEDLTMKFYSAQIVVSLGDDNVVRVEGQLYDGASFEGQDCVTLVGGSASRAVASDNQERGFEVRGNYPNPFNPSTRISFYLPEAADVKLEIFNVLGQHVSTLIDQLLEAGEHSVTWNATEAASGIYYYRLQAGYKIFTDKMLLLK